jgi:outer membrane murein-binding lipoprotein Lpp
MNVPTAFQSSSQKTATNSASYNAQTTFEQLPQDVQNMLAQVQTALSNASKTNDFINAMPLPKKQSKLTDDVDLLEMKLVTIKTTVNQYSHLADEVKEKVQGALRNAEIVFAIYRELSVSKSTRFSSQESPCQIMWDLLKDCDQNISHIRVMIDYLEQSVGASIQPFNEQSLKNILTDEQQLLLAATSQYQAIHEIVDNLKIKYMQFRKHYYNDSHDPFKDLLKEESDEPLFKPKKLQSQVNIDAAIKAQQQQQPGTTGNAFSFGGSSTTTNSAFNFGTPNATTTTTSSFSFGNKPATGGPSFSFGPNATTPALPSTLGSTTTSTTPSFSFGGSTATTTTQSSTGTFSFGANTAGSQATTNTFSFGTKK